MKKIISAAAVSLLLSGAAIAQTQQPAAGTAPAAPATSAAPAMNVDTPTFVQMAASSNMFEIESSKLAEEKSENDDIEEFAEQMIEDHTKAGEEMKAAAGDMPEPKLAPKHAAMIEQLRGVEGADFDAQYLDMQAQAHVEAVTLFTNYSQSGDDEKLVAFAKKTLPTLQMHEEHVKKIVAAQ